MSRKFKVIISVLVAVLLLAVGGTAVAMAQDEPEPEPQTAGEGLLARVASILGISQDELADAFQQAQQEMREECQATGTICQQEMNRFRNCWMEQRQQRGEGNQQWMEQRQQRNQRFQCDGTQQQTRLHLAQGAGGRQMRAVPGGWNCPFAPQTVD